MKIALSICFSLFTGQVWAERFEFESTPTSVVVSPQGGIITREIVIDIPAGQHSIVVSGLPKLSSVEGSAVSIPQSSGLELVAIEGGPVTTDRLRFKNSTAYKKALAAVKTAQANVHTHQTRIADQQAGLDAAELRLSFLRQFAQGTHQNLTFESATDTNVLSNLSQQIDTQARDAISQVAKARRALEVLALETENLEVALEQANFDLDALTPPTKEEMQAVLFVNAKRPFNGAIKLQYLEYEVSWYLLSDVHLTQNAAKGDLLLTRKAVLNQQTSENWEGVKVTLSTADLERAVGNNLPLTKVKRLYDFETQKRKSTYQTKRLNDLAQTVEPTVIGEVEEVDNAMGGAMALLAGQTQIFEISHPVTIKSGASTAVLPLPNINMSVDLYARVNAVDEAAYLYADVTNDTGGRILPSLASIYRDGQYFGWTELEEIVAGDETPLQLGVVDGILVEHTIVKKEDGDRGILSSSQIAENRFKTEVTSLLDYDLTVKLYDRIPISEEEDLVIREHSEPKPTDRNIEGRRGVLAWNFNLKAGSSETILFGYDLNWPTGKTVE